MKKYLSIAALFLFGNEVISWIALSVIAVVAVVEFAKEADYEANLPRS